MLKLEVSQPGRALKVVVDDSDVRCPFAWGFVLFRGEAPEVVLYSSYTVDFAYGHNGARIRSSGAVEADQDYVEHDGASACATGGGGIVLNFRDLPVGTLYLLQYKAGTPFEGLATLSAPAGGVRVVGQSSGDRVVYLGSEDFAESSTHVEVYGPQACGGPSLDPGTGFCKPQYRWPGGLLPGVDVAMERSASVTFHDRPYFTFGANTNLVGVTNASLRDPLGLIHSVYASTGVDAGPAAANVGGVSYTTRGRATDHPSGEYAFHIRMNANVGAGVAVPWHLSGVDYHFPEEAP